MSAEWDACGPEFQARARNRATRINALTFTAGVMEEFGMKLDSINLRLRAMTLMSEDIQDMQRELRRVGFKKEKQ